MTPLMRQVLAALAGKRFPLENEKACQAAIADAFTAAWRTSGSDGEQWMSLDFEREAKICGGVIDFVVIEPWSRRAVGVEVKLKGQPDAIRRQLKGYAADEDIAGLVLVTAKPVGVVQLMRGKPVAEFDLGRAWL